jgi:hypothetical protein
MKDPNFKALLDKTLISLDDSFVRNNVQIKDRASQAALIILKYCITSLRSEEFGVCEGSEYYIDTPMFPAVYNYVADWYRKRYGDRINENGLDLYGLVFFRNCPFAITFPYCMNIDEGHHDTISVKFLDKYSNAENWEEYLLSPPDLKDISDSERVELQNKVIESVEIIRNNFTISP